MNTKAITSLTALLVACGSLCMTAGTALGVSLTITPSSVPLDYAGVVTLNITGLATGQTVLVEGFLDANRNGAIDAGEILVQSFQVTDGQAFSIGGVRNTSVPGDDDDAADGTIHTALNFFAETNHAVAKFAYKVSPTTSGFAPVTASLTVTQPAYAQKVVGKVTSGGSPVPYAFTFLVPSLNSNPEIAALADANGDFTLNAAVGTHLVLAIKDGFVTNFSAPPAVTLGAGATVTQNVSLSGTDRTISGRLTEVGSDAAIPGVQMEAQSNSGLFTLVFSDATGNFVIPVSSASAQWRIGVSGKSLALSAHVGSRDYTADVSGGNPPEVSIQVPKATALIYGTLKDDQGNPLAGVGLYPNNNQYEGYARTDSGGYYVAGVPAGTWEIGPDSSELAPRGYLGRYYQVTVNSGDAVRQDLEVRHITAHLSGRVTDDNSQAVGDICINAYPDQGGSVDTQTDGDGNFSFGVVGGTWHIKLCSDDAQQRGLVGPTLTYSVQDGVDVTNIPYVARRATVHITGWVKDNTNAPIAGVGVNAHLTGGGTPYDLYQQTDSGGNFSLGAFNGTWQVELSCGDLQSRGYPCVSGQSVMVASADATAYFTVPLPGSLQITTTSLQNGRQGQSYGVQLSATGGVGSYNWDLAPGSQQLPPWLNLSSGGYLSGTPTNGGTYNFTVRVTDAASHTAVQGLSLFITTQPLQINTYFPSGQVGVAYSVPLQANGGQPPYTWSMTPGSGPLPPGLTLSGSTVSGTPTTAGNSSFYIRVTDSANSTVDGSFSISISPAPLQWITASLPDGAVGSPYSKLLQATGGVPPYYWALAPGSLALPPGLILDPGGTTPTPGSTPGGTLYGTPTTEGAFNFILRVSDGYFQSVDRPFSLLIRPAVPTPTITPTPTPTPTPTATETPVPCVGDCSTDGRVTIDELIKGINIALGFAVLGDCPTFDCNGDGEVTIDCLIKAVNATLRGCVAIQ